MNRYLFDSGNVTIWFRDRWSSLAAIVSTDFFLGNNIIDLAIQENQWRYSSNWYKIIPFKPLELMLSFLLFNSFDFF